MIGTAGTVVVFRRLERPARSSSETIACCLLAIVFCPLKGARATMSKSHSSNCARPAGAFLRTIGLAAGLATLGTGAIEKAQGQTDANPMKPIPIPAQVPAKDGVAQIPETRLWYWDTGGPGVPIVLLHPATGSALIWGLPAAGVREGRLPRHRLLAARLLQLRALRPEQSWYRLRGPSAPRGCPGPWKISCRGVGSRRQYRVGFRVFLPGPAFEPDHFQQFLRGARW